MRKNNRHELKLKELAWKKQIKKSSMEKNEADLSGFLNVKFCNYL